MENSQTFFSETSEHAATLTGDKVVVFRKGRGGAQELTEIGVGRWEGGIVRGSGVNCGVLVRLEQDLRAQTGTP
jgi:hypothetical protein